MPFGLPLFLQNGNFPLHSRVKAQRHTAPCKLTPLPGIAKELLPAGALRSNVVGTCGSPHKRPLQKRSAEV